MAPLVHEAPMSASPRDEDIGSKAAGAREPIRGRRRERLMQRRGMLGAALMGLCAECGWRGGGFGRGWLWRRWGGSVLLGRGRLDWEAVELVVVDFGCRSRVGEIGDVLNAFLGVEPRVHQGSVGPPRPLSIVRRFYVREVRGLRLWGRGQTICCNYGLHDKF